MLNFSLFFIILLLIVGIFVWLIRADRKLRVEVIALKELVDSMKSDVAGLCSAAVSVDNQLANNNEQLLDVVEKVIDFEKSEYQSNQPYHSAIQMVRNGAEAEELIQQFGLSREEAILLIRLHGAGREN